MPLSVSGSLLVIFAGLRSLDEPARKNEVASARDQTLLDVVLIN